MAPKEKKDENEEAGVIKVPIEDFKALTAHVKSLEDRLSASEKVSGTTDLEEPTVRTAKVRLYDGRPISKLENVVRTKKFENDGSEIMECDVTYVDAAGEYKLVTTNYLELLRAGDQETCEIVDIEDIPVKVKPKNEPERIQVVKPGEWAGEPTGMYVKNVVTLHKITYTVDFKGEKLRLETVNI